MSFDNHMLPDPHDDTWEGCLLIYRAHRKATLDRLAILNRKVDQIDMWIDRIMTDNDRDLTNAEADEAEDRLHCASLMMSMERSRLWSLRMYLEHCRVVYHMADRATHMQILRNLDLGISPRTTRRLMQQGMRRDH